MKRFRFPLDAALRWRSEQAREEERKLERLRDELESRRRALQSLRARVACEVNEVFASGVVDGTQLSALNAFKLRARADDLRVTGEIEICAKQIDAQRAKTIEARRAAKLLERLREKRLAEWRAGFAKELEQTATELFLARQRSS